MKSDQQQSYNIYIDQTACRSMGQSSSKPHSNQQIQQLKQLYQPTSKLSHLPGQPLCIQYFPSFERNHNPIYAQKYPFLQLYSFELDSSQKQIAQDLSIYEVRKNSLPWIVKVVCYDVERKQCQCSLFSCKYTVCTERIEFRLHSFKTSGKGFADLTGSKKYLQSFTLEEGVYVLINAIQGYQILTQQFRVKCPSARSIGITRQGQVKVWINENWALNEQNPIAIPDRQIIEQILTLTAQRTKGNLLKMLGIENGLLNFNFNQIQNILAHFVIAFNQGKKILAERVSEASLGLLDVSATKPRKYSLKKEKQEQTEKVVLTHTPHKSKHTNQTTERRFYSHDLKKQKIEHSISHNHNHSAKKESSHFNAAQPKKQIKFSYPQMGQVPYYPNSAKGSSSQPIHFTPQSANEPNPKIIFRSQPVITKFNHLEQKNNSLPLFEKVISRKISDNARTTIATTFSFNDASKIEDKSLNSKLNMVVNTNHQFKKSILEMSQSQKVNILGAIQEEKKAKRQLLSLPLKQKQENAQKSAHLKPIPKTVSFVTPQSFLARGQILVTQYRSQNTPSKVESINSITQEFRQLLQSEKQIESELELDQQLFDIALLSLQKSQKHLKPPQTEVLLYQKSESDIIRPSMTKCYSIKQVDEEISYEWQANNM